MTGRSGELGETDQHSAKRKKTPKHSADTWQHVVFLCLLMPTVLPGNRAKVESCKQKQKKKRNWKHHWPDLDKPALDKQSKAIIYLDD